MTVIGTVSEPDICVSTVPGPPADSVTVTQSVMVIVSVCCPVAGIVIETEVGRGCGAVSLPVVEVDDPELTVKMACGEDVGTGTGIISVRSEEVKDVGSCTGVISVNS